MARLALDCLSRHQDEFDIYINNIRWGQTSWLHEENEQYLNILNFRIKTEKYIASCNNAPSFDISLQITIPNEWKKMAPVNIGYTAGIETTAISPAWLDPCRNMEKIITISNFSKDVFCKTEFNDSVGNTYKVGTPIDVIYFPYKDIEPKKLDLNLDTEFNFLCVNQWGPRKNMEQLIFSFIGEFKNDNVGLVLKTNMGNDSVIDKYNLENLLKRISDSNPDKKCKIYLLHGRMSDEEMAGLYRHPKIKGFVTSTHGEGFGLPIFEAMAAELPIVATDWSGHLEYLSVGDKKLFGKVDYELGAIKPEHVWKNIMEPNTGWAYPRENSLRNRMRELYKDHGRFKSWAKKLAEHNKEKFTKEKIYNEFYKSVNFLWNKDVDSSNDLIFSTEE